MSFFNKNASTISSNFINPVKNIKFIKVDKTVKNIKFTKVDNTVKNIKFIKVDNTDKNIKFLKVDNTIKNIKFIKFDDIVDAFLLKKLIKLSIVLDIFISCIPCLDTKTGVMFHLCSFCFLQIQVNCYTNMFPRCNDNFN
jgi:hypothetical protein